MATKQDMSPKSGPLDAVSPEDRQAFIEEGLKTAKEFGDFMSDLFGLDKIKHSSIDGILKDYADPDVDSVELARRVRGTSDQHPVC